MTLAVTVTPYPSIIPAATPHTLLRCRVLGAANRLAFIFLTLEIGNGD